MPRYVEKYITRQHRLDDSTLTSREKIDFWHYISTVKNAKDTKLLSFHAYSAVIRQRKPFPKFQFTNAFFRALENSTVNVALFISTRYSSKEKVIKKENENRWPNLYLILLFIWNCHWFFIFGRFRCFLSRLFLLILKFFQIYSRLKATML